jgi:hypothetical protein
MPPTKRRCAMMPRLAKRIILLVMLTATATLLFVPLTQATTYEIVATVTESASVNPGLTSWSLIYEDMDNSGRFSLTDKVISFTGLTWTGPTPDITYSQPILGSPVASDDSPFSDGTGMVLTLGLNAGRYYPDNWNFTPSLMVTGSEGGVWAGYFTYTQTAVPLPPSALLLGSGLLGLAATGLRRRWTKEP